MTATTGRPARPAGLVLSPGWGLLALGGAELMHYLAYALVRSFANAKVAKTLKGDFLKHGEVVFMAIWWELNGIFSGKLSMMMRVDDKTSEWTGVPTSVLPHLIETLGSCIEGDDGHNGCDWRQDSSKRSFRDVHHNTQRHSVGGKNMSWFVPMIHLKYPQLHSLTHWSCFHYFPFFSIFHTFSTHMEKIWGVCCGMLYFKTYPHCHIEPASSGLDGVPKDQDSEKSTDGNVPI